MTKKILNCACISLISFIYDSDFKLVIKNVNFEEIFFVDKFIIGALSCGTWSRDALESQCLGPCCSGLHFLEPQWSKIGFQLELNKQLPFQ